MTSAAAAPVGVLGISDAETAGIADALVPLLDVVADSAVDSAVS
ncbi:hypothetical protein [Nocardia sp. NPDC057030]